MRYMARLVDRMAGPCQECHQQKPNATLTRSCNFAEAYIALRSQAGNHAAHLVLFPGVFQVNRFQNPNGWISSNE